jgi:diguanylate cyclase (GGDEF)-like protein
MQRFVLSVVAAGSLGIFFTVAVGLPHLRLDAVALTLVACTVVAESVPIKIPRHGFIEELTCSFTFAFALLLYSGPVLAILSLVLASIASDLRHRKPFVRLLFNASQYALGMSAAAGVLAVFSDVPRAGAGTAFLPGDVPAVLLAAGCFFAVNIALVGTVSALHQRVPVIRHLWADLGIQGPMANLMLGMAPVVVLVCDFSLWLLPLAVLPMVAVHRSGQAVVRDRHRALHDGLTQLPNRTNLRDRVQHALVAPHRSGGALVILDLDSFKEVNDTLGHLVGDELLRSIARRLADAVDPLATVARLGGDEFAVCLPEVTSDADLSRALDRIHEVFEQPVELEQLSLQVSGSLGIARWPQHGTDVETLLQRADIALYKAKDGHVRSFEFTPGGDEHSVDRLALLGQLRDGIGRGELTVYGMPLVDLPTGSADVIEVLVRWDHPERGVVPPAVFIPHAESTGLIRQLTLEVLDQGLGVCAAWWAVGHRTRIAVNLSTRSLLDQGLPEDVRRLLARHGLPAEALELEITESTIMADPERARGTLHALNQLGVSLAIDDFGTGYTSLAYLRDLPVDTLKIDRRFISGMQEHERDLIIVRSIIDLARNLGLQVVAEGVEGTDVCELLADLGCHRVQGFLFGRPVELVPDGPPMTGVAAPVHATLPA